jgi:hypothetical protein
MRIRQIITALAAMVVLALSACASEQAGSAVSAEGAEAGASPADPGSNSGQTTATGTEGAPTSSAGSASETDGTPIESGPDPATSASETDGDPAPSAPEPTTSASETSGSGASSGTKADVWPTEICKLMPADVVKGMEREDGDPQLRCMYAAVIDHNYTSAILSKGSFSVDPEELAGPGTDGVKEATVDGRKAWSYLSKNTKTAWVTFDTAPEGSALVAFGSEAKSDDENRAAAIELAIRVSKALRSDAPMTGAVTAPPTTTHPKVPAGTRAWPPVICDLMPEKMLNSMEKSRGYESQSCRLSTDTKNGFSKISVTRTVPPSDLNDPSRGMGKDLKKESFDGREAYSYLYGSGSVPTVYVLFSTGGRDWAEVRVAETDVVNQVKPEKVRADALALAKEIAPKLPKP